MLSLILSLLWLPQAVQPTVAPSVSVAVYVPERVYDTRRQAFADLESMLADLAKADVVFVGEQHDDPNTHRLESAILDGLRRRGVPVTLSLEMFERDAQPGVNSYLAGGITEEDFLKSSAALAALLDRLSHAGGDGTGRKGGPSLRRTFRGGSRRALPGRA